MKYKVSSGDKTVELTPEELFTILLEKITDSPPEEAVNLSIYLKNLLPHQLLETYTIYQYSDIYFLAGYLYANFLHKNEIEIIKENK